MTEKKNPQAACDGHLQRFRQQRRHQRRLFKGTAAEMRRAEATVTATTVKEMIMMPSSRAVLGFAVVLVLLSPARLQPQGSANATLPELLSAGYSHSVYLYREAQELYTAYISVQGAPFSDPAFSAPELQLSGLPTAVVSYSVWRALSPAQRLGDLVLAYGALCEFLLLASDDQTGLGRAELGARLATTRSQLLALTMSARAALSLLQSGTEGHAQLAGEPQGSAASDPLSGAAASAGDWSRKVRGFVVVRDLRAWLARSVRDFYLLKTQLP